MIKVCSTTVKHIQTNLQIVIKVYSIPVIHCTYIDLVTDIL